MRPRNATPAPRVFDGPLRYVGSEPGIRRIRRGRGYSYLQPDGTRVEAAATLRRARSLAIPPAWTSVWICADARGHLQATGRDGRGRKQYRYHPDWSARRNESKFDQLVEFGEVLPRIRRRLTVELGRTGLTRERVLATVIRLLDSTYARVGNREYRRANGSFGLTLLTRHARQDEGSLRLVFRGKSGVLHSLKVHDRRVARIVQRCQALPGQALFQYLDEEGAPQAIHSEDVNDWLREQAGSPITAKQFRTWHASALALEALLALDPPGTLAERREAFLGVVDAVAAQLGNTRTVCRKHYLHPDLETEFLDGLLFPPSPALVPSRSRGLLQREALLLSWLKRHAASPARPVVTEAKKGKSANHKLPRFPAAPPT